MNPFKFIAPVTALLVGLLILPPPATAMDAQAVMEAVDARDKGNTAISDTRMILVDRNKKQRIREMKSIRKEYGEDTKGIIFFLSPADVRNTAYMSFDWEKKEDDSWLFLPAMAKVKRIAAKDKSGAFMGSDFSYSDINGMDIKDWDYSFVKKSYQLDGVETWVIKGRPKPQAKERVAEETGYAKILVWVRKDNLVIVKAKYWVTQGQKIKYFKAEDIEEIDGIWTPLKLTMVTTEKGKVSHSTVMKLSNVMYNTQVKDGYFTPVSMEQGF
ncbi:MAG: outer membrane lipoprotein-sorting protein [Desulfobacterales bacterium]|nr:outer membrane lipoprotein-sorting protein [Desulfobacterales bacterium]